MRTPKLLGALALAGCASAPRPAATTTTPMPPTPTMPAPDTVARAATQPRPTLGSAPALNLPPVVTRDLPNGMKLLVVEQHELPVADFLLLVGTGGEADPAGRSGLATLTAALLEEGAAKRTSLDISDQAAFLGVQLNTTSGWDASSVSLHTPTAQLDSAMALFADVALRPTFPAKELERLRQERLTGLLQLKDRGPAIADRAYASTIYGSAHPYGQPLSGTLASTRGITRADVQRYYSTYYRPNNATLIVVGDVTPDDVAARVTRAFGAWTRGTIPETRYPTVSKRPATTVYLVDKPGAAQSSFRIGTVGVPRNTSDYFALMVMNTILGGSFTSRLNNNLRETKGYTYGANSGFSMRRNAGPFTARAEIVTAKTDSALIEFMKELGRIRDTVPADELAKAKQFLELQLPGDFETTGQIAGQLVPVVVYGLPPDFYNTYVRNVEAVTQADVSRVAQQRITPENLTIVIVGDRKVVEPGLQALKVGPITVRTVESVTGGK